MAILKYKNAEGNFVPLNNYLVQPITPVQTTGSSPTDIMSQAAVTDAINQGLDTKVTKIEGKGLSTNDYTTPEKNKLAAIEAEANKYILPAATTSALGGIIVGDRLSIDSTGKLVATYTYTLPTASGTVLGGVKTGSNITNTSGTISLTKANVTAALGVDPTTTYVKKAGDSMAGDLTSTAKVQANILKSTVATGTAPVQVTSTTVCTNLNADMIDGKNASDFQPGLCRSLKFNSNSSTVVYKWCDVCRIANGYQNYSILMQISALQSALTCSIAIGHTSANISILSSSLVHNGEFNQIIPKVRIVNKTTQNERWVQCLFKQGTTNQNTGNNIMAVNITSSNNQITLVDYLQEDSTTYSNSDVWEYAEATNNGARINIASGEAVDWYGVSWSETSSNPDCTRIGNMDMHRTLPIQSMMKPFAFSRDGKFKDQCVPLLEDFITSPYVHNSNTQGSQDVDLVNIMVKIPEFWYSDDYVHSTKTHNLKICPHAKPGWNHHKEAYVSAYELYNLNNVAISKKGKIPTVNFNRTDGRTWARANGFEGESKWNLYTYEEHRAICHLFLIEYATRNSQKAVNTSLTVEGFRQGGLGSGCTTGTATINGVTTYSFIPTGSSNSLGSGSGEVTVTVQQTDASGNNTTTVTRKCNRYRGIENPFGHVWKHCDDIISVYSSNIRTWHKSTKPDQFSTNKNASYKSLCSSTCVTQGYKTEIKATPTCDFFAMAASGGSENTYWCDYNWDNTDTTEHCLLIGGYSGDGGQAGLFYLDSYNGVGASSANVGSRLTYLPWAE